MTQRQSNSKFGTDTRVILISAVVTLANLAVCIHRSSRVYLLQQSQCLQHYLATAPEHVSAQWEVEEALCRIPQVQAPLSTLEGVDAFLQLLPALLVLPTYQKLLPIIGLGRLLLINVSLVALGILLSMLFYSLHQAWTNVAILLTFMCDMLGGGDLTRTTLCLTVIADLLPPDKLTNVNNYITALYIFASVAASAIGSVLLSHHVYILNFLGVLCSIGALGVAIFIPRHLACDDSSSKGSTGSSANMLLRPDEDVPDIGTQYSRSESEQHDSISHILLTSWKSSLAATFTLFRVANPTFAVLVVFFIYAFCSRVEVLNQQYISLALNWRLATVNALLATKAMVSATLLLALPTINKKLLQPRMNSAQSDLFLVNFSLLSSLIGITGYGFPLPGPLFSFALYIYTSGIAFYASITTFGRSTLPPGEKSAEFFVRIGLAQTIAGLIGAGVWTSIFRYCIKSDFWPIGTPFWICACLFGGAIVFARRLRGQAHYHAASQVD